MRKAGLYRSHTTNDWQAYWPYRLFCLQFWAMLTQHRRCAGCKHTTWFKWSEKRCLAIDWDCEHRRKFHGTTWASGVLFFQSNSNWHVGSLSIMVWSRSVLALKIYTVPQQSPTSVIYPIHMLNTTYLCIFKFNERGELKISCQRCVSE